MAVSRCYPHCAAPKRRVERHGIRLWRPEDAEASGEGFVQNWSSAQSLSSDSSHLKLEIQKFVTSIKDDGGSTDELIKGAAGNAIQVMNIMLGLDEKQGIYDAPLHPV